MRILFAFFLSLAPTFASEVQISALWGTNGEAWDPASRLPDFSQAGYAAGQKPLPRYPAAADVRDFGAKGDGVTDDTAAFQQAIREVREGGAVLVPAGRYVITDVLTIDRSGVALRGEGADRSVLVLPKPLSEVRPLANVDETKSAYSFTGGFVLLVGQDKGATVSKVINAAKRGDSQLTLASAGSIKPGDWIRLVMKNPPDHSLLRHIHGDVAEPGEDTPNLIPPAVDWAAQIVSVEGNVVTLNRPLRLDVRLKWEPEIFAMTPTLSESGIEDLGFEFSGEPKRPHLQEAGFNAIHIQGAVNCWIRNVTVTDADNGVIMAGSRFCTVEGFTTLAAKRSGLTGHHALWATGMTQDGLFTRFRLTTPYIHDLTVEGLANGNVFTMGTGVSVNCDHHRNAPYENLFTDFDAGDPGRLFESSGREDRGPHSAARTTFWGIRGEGKFPPLPPAAEWPVMNVIGFGSYPPSCEARGLWVEAGDGGIAPANLWEAQVKRLGPGR